MTLRNKTFIIVLLSIISITILGSMYLLSNKQKPLKLTQKREFITNIELVKSVKTENKLSLIKYFKHKLYFVSWTKNNQGKLFNIDIDSLDVINEFSFNNTSDSLLIGNYFLTKDTVYLFNKMKNSIILTNLNSEKLGEYTYPKRFSRIEKSNNNFLISGWDENFNIYFDKFNLNTKNITPIDFNDEYLSYYDMNGIALDGFYHSNEDYIIMLPYSVNRIFLFNKNLNFIKSMDLIYEKNEFKFRKSDNGDIYIDPNNLDPNLWCSLHGNLLFVMSDFSTKWDNKDKCYIDIYKINSGQYFKSIKINDFKGSKPKYLLVKDNKLFILFKDYLNQYEFAL